MRKSEISSGVGCMIGAIHVPTPDVGLSLGMLLFVLLLILAGLLISHYIKQIRRKK